VEKETGTNEAARFMKMLLTNPLAADTPAAEKMTGYKYKDEEKPEQIAAVNRLNDEFRDRMMNLIANTGLLPGNQKFLIESMEQLKKTYIGELSVILDSNMKSGSTSTVQDTGNYKDMAEALSWIETTPTAQIESRKGGSPYSSVNNDSIEAYKQMAESYLIDSLKSLNISLIDTDRDARIVTGHDGQGNSYRIRGMEKNMPKTGGGEIKRTVLVIEKREKGKEDWQEISELTKAQLDAGENAVETLRQLNEPAPGTPQSEAVRRQAEQRKRQQLNRGINWGGASF
jgi:hypothetical protein